MDMDMEVESPTYDSITPENLSSKFPETSILSVNIHGGFDLRDDKPEEFSLPEGTTMTIIPSAPPGVCSFQTEKRDELLQEIIDQRDGINQVFQDYPDFGYEIATEILVKRIIEWEKTNQKPEIEFLRNYEKIIPTLQKTGLFTEGSKETVSDMKKLYIHGDDLRFIPDMYKSSEPQYKPINKTFEKRVSEIDTKGIYGARINILNMEGVPDLSDPDQFPDLPIKKIIIEGEEIIIYELRDIVIYLRKNGVKHIIIIDYSCSNFSNADDRKTRRLRRSIHSRRTILKYRKNGKNGKNKTSKERKLQPKLEESKRRSKKGRNRKVDQKRKSIGDPRSV
jgi:hypothetical protein